MRNIEYKNLVSIVLVFAAFALNIYSQEYKWVSVNGSVHPPIRSLAVSNNGDIYAATGQGLLKSTDSGNTWNTNFYNGYEIKYVAISNNGYIFASTWGNGVIRSSDQGKTWKAKNNGVSEYYSGWIFITDQDIIFAHTVKGLYRSTDLAESWIKCIGIHENIWPLSFASKHNSMFFGTRQGLYKSIDAGLSWEEVNLSIFEPPEHQVFGLASDHSGNLYAGTSGVRSSDRIVKSTDDGNNWTVIKSGLGEIRSIIINNGSIIVSGSEINISTNWGSTWFRANIGGNSTINSTIILDSYRLICGVGREIGIPVSGFWNSNDNGLNWYRIDANLADLETSILYSVDNYLFAYKGSGWNSLFCSTNEGGNWTEINDGLEYRYVRTLVSDLNADYVFAGSIYGIDRAVMGEFMWTRVLGGQYIGPFQSFAVNSNNKIYAGDCCGVYMSDNLGLNWIFNDFNTPTATRIETIAINSQDDVFAGSYGFGIYRSTDDGNTWVSVNNGLTDLDVFTLAIDSKDIVYAGTCNSGIFRSTDHGNLWELTTIGLTDSCIRALCINSKDELFTSTRDSGVFFSNDSGKIWQEINAGLTNLETLSLSVNSEDRIFVGTTSRIDGNGGVFKLVKETDNGTPDPPESFILYNNFPNPFNSVTKIRFELPQNEVVVIDVYDILGQKVNTILNEYRTADRYEIEFNAANLPSGIYFYQLRAGDPSAGSGQSFVETKKMVLLK